MEVEAKIVELTENNHHGPWPDAFDAQRWLVEKRRGNNRWPEFRRRPSARSFLSLDGKTLLDIAKKR